MSKSAERKHYTPKFVIPVYLKYTVAVETVSEFCYLARDDDSTLFQGRKKKKKSKTNIYGNHGKQADHMLTGSRHK